MKAIRDFIPRDMPGRRYGKMEGTAYLDLLVQKLHEEASEVNEAILKAESSERIAEELADVIEVVYAIAKRIPISNKTVGAIRVEKARTRGAFDEGWVIS